MSDDARRPLAVRRWLLKRRIQRAAKRLKEGRISKTQYSAVALASLLELEGQIPRDSASLAGKEVDCALFLFGANEEPEFGEDFGPIGGAPMQLLRDSSQTGAQEIRSPMDSPVLVWTAATDRYLQRSIHATGWFLGTRRIFSEWLERDEAVFPALHSAVRTVVIALFSAIVGALLALMFA